MGGGRGGKAGEGAAEAASRPGTRTAGDGLQAAAEGILQALSGKSRVEQVGIIRDALESVAPPGEEGRAVRADARVLVVEDNRVSQRFTLVLLEGLGIRAEAVDDGRLAVELAARTPYDLILMDCMLPVMDGYEASKAIRAQPGARPVIVAMTGHSGAAELQMCLDSGMDDYLPKPVRRERLLEILRKYAPART